MNKKLLLICLMLFVSVLVSCIVTGRRSTKQYNCMRYGPVLLKIDNEWVFHEGNRNLIRIGFYGKNIAPGEFEYENVSPESLAVNKSSIIIEPQNNKDSFNRNIVYYDIPIKSNELWIDLYLYLENSYKQDDRMRSIVFNYKGFYIFHPSKKKWWGVYPGRLLTIDYLNEDIYSHHFSSFEDFKEYDNKLHTASELNYRYTLGLLGKRIFRIPSTKIYDEQMNGVLEEYRMFSWYVETAEKENVKPKTDDE